MRTTSHSQDASVLWKKNLAIGGSWIRTRPFASVTFSILNAPNIKRLAPPVVSSLCSLDSSGVSTEFEVVTTPRRVVLPTTPRDRRFSPQLHANTVRCDVSAALGVVDASTHGES